LWKIISFTPSRFFPNIYDVFFSFIFLLFKNVQNTCTFSNTLKFFLYAEVFEKQSHPDSLSFPNLESVRQHCAFYFFGQRQGTSVVIFANKILTL